MDTLTPASLLRGLLLLAVIAVGARAEGVRFSRGVEADKPAATVALSVAMADAHRLAAIKGDKVVRVEGASMLPYFGDGSVLVVKAAKLDALREGMVVVYKNRFGETVAHRVDARVADGWTVRGANNLAADSTVVTTENLLGTVYATFYSDPRTREASLAAVGALAAVTDVALAAPAR